MPARSAMAPGGRAVARRLACALAPLCLLTAAGAEAQPYAVHVFTAADGAADERARVDSVDDLRRALDERDYQPLFRLVESPASADLLIEVAWRGAVESTTTVTTTRPVPGGGGPPLGSRQRVRQNNVRVTLHARGGVHELWAVDPGRPSRFGGIPHLSWRELAGRAAERAARWVRENHERVRR